LRQIRKDGSPTPFYDVLLKLADGAGFQARHRNVETDFRSDDAYERPEDGADPYFYALPRLTAHLDSRAQQTVGAFYREVLPERGHLLDLMSSLHSNLDAGQSYKSLTGLGLNAEELASNQGLTNAVIADLNKGCAIPLGDCAFDGAICTVSIDYLIHPVQTLAEVGRILKADAPFAAAYSNRWFPTKVTKLWTELHPFERLGLLATYLSETGSFCDLETYSIRGLPRPPDDLYSDQTADSDPIFAIAARKAM
jgi:SAM-dependent methyltransferase